MTQSHGTGHQTENEVSMNSIEKIGAGGLAAVGAGAVGAGIGYVAVELPVFPYNARINDAKQELACADALVDTNGRIELPGDCDEAWLIESHRNDRQTEAFFEMSEDGILSRTTREITIFDTTEEITEAAALRHDRAETDKQDVQELSAGIMAGLAIAAFAGWAVIRWRNKPSGKHSISPEARRRQRKHISDPHISSENETVSTNL